MSNLRNIEFWRNSFGLLPIHLDQSKFDSRYVMLNGGVGDFCLQLEDTEEPIDSILSNSWSTNTKNYLVTDKNSLKLLNWTTSKAEIVNSDIVENHFDKLYKYIYSKSFQTHDDIVPFILDIFKQFRNLTLEKTNPVEALNLLFVLLASIQDPIEDINFEKWNIKETKIPIGFEKYSQRLKSGIRNLTPNLDLVLRHASGTLFQEAQKEVLFFDSQINLFGEISNSLVLKNRNYSSVHYTPSFLSRTIVEHSLNHLDLRKNLITILDPACGSGEFLIETLKQLKERQFSGKVHLIGYDTSEMAVNTTKFLLQYEIRKVWIKNLSFHIEQVDDSLQKDWNTNIDLILMNPPFVSWELLKKKEQRDSVRETLGTLFERKPNMASAFFYKAIESVHENGIIGTVIPSSILTSNSYSKLRAMVEDKIDFHLIGKLGNFIFEDALTDVSMFVGTINGNKNNSKAHILWTKNESGIVRKSLRELRKLENTQRFSTDTEDYSIYKPMEFPIFQNSWKTLSYRENDFVKSLQRFKVENRLTSIKEIFSVRQGINSGKNSVFKIGSRSFEKLPNAEKSYFKPVVDNNAISKGRLLKKNYIWFPYNEEGLRLKTEDEFKNKVPTFFAEIYEYKNVLAKRRNKGSEKWWHLSEHRAWLLKETPRLVSTRFGNSNSFAFDTMGEFVVENGNAFLPKKEFELDSYFFYLAIFSTPLFDKLLSIYSKQLSGGKWYDLGAKYSGEIPIPDIFLNEVIDLEATQKLIDIGKEISDGNFYATSAASQILQNYFYPSFE